MLLDLTASGMNVKATGFGRVKMGHATSRVGCVAMCVLWRIFEQSWIILFLDMKSKMEQHGHSETL